MRNLIIALVAVAAVALLAGSTQAATVDLSATAPTVDGEDISMLDMTNATGRGKFWPGESFAAGQTFTTGSNSLGYSLDAVSIRFEASGLATKTYDVRVGYLTPDEWNVDGEKTFNLISSETFTQDSDAVADDFLTFGLESPVALDPNTEYCLDVHMTGSTSHWSTGIPTVYQDKTNDNYTGGEAYLLSCNTDGDNQTWSAADLETAHQESGDWIFHMDMSTGVIPEPASLMLLGLGCLGFILRRRKRQ